MYPLFTSDAVDACCTGPASHLGRLVSECFYWLTPSCVSQQPSHHSSSLKGPYGYVSVLSALALHFLPASFLWWQACAVRVVILWLYYVTV